MVSLTGIPSKSLSLACGNRLFAGVSSSTIYVYFENKEDMLNKLFLMAKEEQSVSMFKGWNQDAQVKAGLENCLRNYVNFSLSFPVKFSFQEQFYNSPNISSETKKTTYHYYEPLLDLIERGIQQGIVRDCSRELISAFTFAPLIFMIRAHHSKELEFTTELVDETIKLVWQSVRA